MCEPGAAFESVTKLNKKTITTVNELRKALQRAGRDPTTEQVANIRQEYDDEITEEDFREIVEDLPATSHKYFTDAMHSVQERGKPGEISVMELRRALSSGQNQMPDADIDEIINLHGRNGSINLVELWDSIDTVLTRCRAVKKQDLKSFNVLQSYSAKFQSAINIYCKTLPKGWFHTTSRGCMLFEESGRFLSQQFEVEFAADTDLMVMIQAISMPMMNADVDPAFNDIDIDLFLLREVEENTHKRLTAYTNVVDQERRFTFRQKVLKGKYTLVPFTSGAWFKPNEPSDAFSSDPDLASKKLYTRISQTVVELTPEYTNALETVYEMADLDGNGSLNRDEFNIFAHRSTGDVVRDEDWKVVTGTFSTHEGQLSREGFMQLHLMEANECNDENVMDLWIMLESMGFNKELFLDKALVYVLNIASSTCNPVVMRPTEIKLTSVVAEKAIIRAAIENGEAELLEDGVVLHKLTTSGRFSLVLENQSTKEQIIKCELKEAVNCLSSKVFPLELQLSPKKSAVLAHFVPRDASKSWKIRTREIVLQ